MRHVEVLLHLLLLGLYDFVEQFHELCQLVATDCVALVLPHHHDLLLDETHEMSKSGSSVVHGILAFGVGHLQQLLPLLAQQALLVVV